MQQKQNPDARKGVKEKERDYRRPSCRRHEHSALAARCLQIAFCSDPALRIVPLDGTLEATPL